MFAPLPKITRAYVCGTLSGVSVVFRGLCLSIAETSLSLSVGRSSVSEVQNFSEEVFRLPAQPQKSANILQGKICKHSSPLKALVNSLSRYPPGPLRKTEPLKPYGGQLLNPGVLASMSGGGAERWMCIKGRLVIRRTVQNQV